MKVIQVNHSDINGGAARAAYRIHHALRHAGVDSRMWVDEASSGDWTVEGPVTRVDRAIALLRYKLGGQLQRVLKSGYPIIHSPQVFPSRWVRRLNASDSDIVHLHWVQGEMLSIADVGRIGKPIVWTLHDMWAFCGAEHLSWDARWREGYRRDNRPPHESGFDLNRWTWNRKRRHWRRPIRIVTPSRWLANCVHESVLMHDWNVTVIPNPLDTSRWRPMAKSLARDLLDLPADVPLLLFGALGGGAAYHKGFDLLVEALGHLRDTMQAKGVELVIFGQLCPKERPNLGFPLHYLGHLHDDQTLRAAYSAVDMMIVPSRVESFGQTASEAHACGTPVVAFHTSGLLDIVEHQQTGYLAKAFDTEDLARGVMWVLEQSDRTNLEDRARKRALERFTMSVVAGQYLEVYGESRSI